jgi:hypothetical protein
MTREKPEPLDLKIKSMRLEEMATLASKIKKVLAVER